MKPINIGHTLKIADNFSVWSAENKSSGCESYFEILEDTLLGFRLPGYETSIRRQVRLADKFYFVDTGMVRAIRESDISSLIALGHDLDKEKKSNL